MILAWIKSSLRYIGRLGVSDFVMASAAYMWIGWRDQLFPRNLNQHLLHVHPYRSRNRLVLAEHVRPVSVCRKHEDTKWAADHCCMNNIISAS